MLVSTFSKNSEHFIFLTTSSDKDSPAPLTPSLFEERIKYLRLIAGATKVVALHISRVVNPHTLSILSCCSPFIVSSGLGNPLAYIQGKEEILNEFLGLANMNEGRFYARGLRTPQKS